MVKNRGRYQGFIDGPRATAPPEEWDEYIAVLKNLQKKGWDMDWDIAEAMKDRDWALKFQELKRNLRRGQAAGIE
ncbi:MAG: hypothetical protein FWD68_17790 [Alphaproteobacteria bacterium]|nr:hypothetical protein [Alphaproteobacteria bacterium]